MRPIAAGAPGSLGGLRGRDGAAPVHPARGVCRERRHARRNRAGGRAPDFQWSPDAARARCGNGRGHSE
jgi:hypothetical protein